MIVTAVQRGGTVCVYGEGKRLLFAKSGQLQGYTSNSVSIKQGNVLCVYNERGILNMATNAK